MVWYIANYTDIAWPWYCLIGATTNIVITIVASVLIDGVNKEYSPYTIRGQIRKFAEEGREEKQEGWYLVPGKVDRVSYLLLVFFVATMLFLFLFGKAF
jgi:SSS family solute:Na+ symporter